MVTELEQGLKDLRALRLGAMATCLEDWMAEPGNRERPVMECIQAMLDAQRGSANNHRVERFFRSADLPPSTCLAGVRASQQRGLSPRLLAELGTCEWVRSGHQIVFMGPSGVGKTYVASALGAHARLKGYPVEYHRVPDLWDAFEDLEDRRVATNRVERKKLFDKLTRVPLLILDDFAAQKANSKQGEVLSRLLDTRVRRKKSTMVASPNHRDDWPSYFDDDTTADRICGRLKRKAQVIELKRHDPPQTPKPIA
jgi:DNA replication protein DnaC